MKVKIHPNAVLPEDMTQEELDSMIADLQKMADNGELEINSEPVDMDVLEKEDPELYNELLSTFEEITEN